MKKDFPKSSGKTKGPRFPRGLLLVKDTYPTQELIGEDKK